MDSSKLQMTKKTHVTQGKSGHREEQGALRSDTSEKLPGHQTFRMCHTFPKRKWQVCPLLLNTEQENTLRESVLNVPKYLFQP